MLRSGRTAREAHRIPCDGHCSGTRNFKACKNPKIRFDILKRLFAIIDKPEAVFRVAVRLDVAKIAASVDVEGMALMYLIERIDDFAREKQTHALLIGDLDSESAVNRAVAGLSQYRASGTKYEYGRNIENVIDTVHFSRSHHSRLLQLADAYLWLQQLMHRTDPLAELRKDLVEFVRQETDIGWPHKYWPGE